MTSESKLTVSLSLKSFNLLIFTIDVIDNKNDTRFIIRDIVSLEKTFLKNKFKFNIYANIENISSIKDDIFEKSINNNDKPIDLFITLDQKLINFDFNKYTIKSYKKLDELNNSKMLDYSLEIS